MTTPSMTSAVEVGRKDADKVSGAQNTFFIETGFGSCGNTMHTVQN
jgi:hypothetical protein